LNIAKWRDVLQRFAGRGVYPYELAFLLESPLRHLILSPKKLANHLHLTTHSHVLEIGPGPGFFSVEVARRIPDGHLVLFDIQYEMLEKSRTKLSQAGVKNFNFVQGSAAILPFSSRVFDIVFLVTVLGEVPRPDECLGFISRVLCPGGLLSVTEMRGDPDALSQSELLQLAEQNGFQFLEQFSFFGGFTLNLRKASGLREMAG
jgi:CAAX protease family protein